MCVYTYIFFYNIFCCTNKIGKLKNFKSHAKQVYAGFFLECRLGHVNLVDHRMNYLYKYRHNYSGKPPCGFSCQVLFVYH